MSGWTQLVGGLCEAAAVEFTLHDLRRTFRTGLTNLGADFDLAELMLGHQRNDLVRRYDRSQRWNERTQFAECWAANVLSLVAAFQNQNDAHRDGAVVVLVSEQERRVRAA
jgi:integrase